MATARQNPILARAGFDATGIRAAGETMTLAGVIRKTFLLLIIALGAMVYVWAGMPGIGITEATLNALMIGGFVGGVGLLLYTGARPARARVTGPLYALVQGLVLGIVTLAMQARYRGIPLQAALLTGTTLAVMLIGYRANVIRASDRFKTIVSSCTLSIFLFYVIAFGMSLFGLRIPFLHEGGVIGIGFSLFVVGLASLNLILDFDYIDKGIGTADEEMEWFAAFSLVVTMIWLYFEILRLLSKLRR